MDPPQNQRRKLLSQAVALMVQEVGYESGESVALEMLTEMFQSILTEMGRTTRMFTELAGRVEPTVGDVTMALVDMGIKVDPVGLRAFSRRSTKPVIPAPGGLPLPKVPSILSAGKKRPLPNYIPDYFPPMPDPHAYIRTPTHKQPLTDYSACREKMSQQKRDLERSLTKYIARTSPCYYIFPENQSMYPMILPKPVTCVDPLVPRDQIFEEDPTPQRLNFVRKEKVVENLPKLNDDDSDNETKEGGAVAPPAKKAAVSVSWELIDNPFLRPVKPFRKSPGKKSS
ncbi:transcription initiation factor TFIID subunit 8 [Folsomia candida]|uniref:Transcription initiation factor TFIID subunit 8 n=1 Tax=Folsomia candida TaxID=158441 RepID=A0A226E1S1_FOLCA|nr:transcription initiation factor TFIID subunit 8 [Folsomia candida]OXA50927.1 Transcription initiation factor TFIID subunit 8 [Folsomia candida]